MAAIISGERSKAQRDQRARPGTHAGAGGEPAGSTRSPARRRSAGAPPPRARSPRASGRPAARTGGAGTVPAGSRPSVAFQSWSTSRRSASVSQGSSERRRSGLSATPSSDGEEMADHPPHRARLEEVAVVAQHSLDGAVPLLERPSPGRTGWSAARRSTARPSSPRRELGPGRAAGKNASAELLRAMGLLQRERDLHQRRAAGVALDVQPLHQQGERIILVLQCLEHRRADAAQQGARTSGRPTGRRGGAAC